MICKDSSQLTIRKSWHLLDNGENGREDYKLLYDFFCMNVMNICMHGFAILNFNLNSVQHSDRYSIKVSLSILIPKVLAAVTGEVNLIRRDLTLHLCRRLSPVKGQSCE